MINHYQFVGCFGDLSLKGFSHASEAFHGDFFDDTYLIGSTSEGAFCYIIQNQRLTDAHGKPSCTAFVGGGTLYGFLEHGAITHQQYNKSLGDMTEKMEC